MGILHTLRVLWILVWILAVFVEADWAEDVKASGMWVYLGLLAWELDLRVGVLEEG